MNNSTVHGSATDGLTFEILSVAVSCDLFLNSFSIHAIFEGLLFPQKAFDPLQFNRMDFTSENQQGLLVPYLIYYNPVSNTTHHSQICHFEVLLCQHITS